MGTIWSSGSRQFAVSTFLRSLPNGYYFGGNHFGQGLPLPQYRNILLNSVFALAPEGDRHLDTFRLWESLSCGCIPLVVDSCHIANILLPMKFPVPVFATWSESLDYVLSYQHNQMFLDNMQQRLALWWLTYKSSLRQLFCHG
jgi:hypothetical protein